MAANQLQIVFRIHDSAEQIEVLVVVNEHYNPDVLEDMKNRAVDAYRKILAEREALIEEGEPASGMDAPIP